MNINLLNVIVSRSCVADSSILRSEYENEHSDDNYLAAATDFLQFLYDKRFLNGVLASSENLYANIQKLQNQAGTSLNKKARQTIEGALEYYSRSAFRTTPFNTFTYLTVSGFDDRSEEKSYEFQTHQVNLKFIQFILTYIENNLPDFPEVFFQMNSSCVVLDDQYKFWFQNKIIGSFQFLERNELLDLIFDYLSKGPLQQRGLIDFLSEYIEEDQEAIATFVQELVVIGFIEIHIAGSLLSEHRTTDFIRFLETILDESHPKRFILDELRMLESSLSDFQLGDDTIYNEFQRLIVSFGEKLSQDQKVHAFLQEDESLSIKKPNLYFAMKPYQLSYTDYFKSAEFSFHKEMVNDRVETLSSYLYYLSVFDVTLKHKNYVDEVFIHYCDEYRVSSAKLFDFYEYYCKKLKETAGSLEGLEELYWEDADRVMDAIHDRLASKKIVNDTLFIELEDLKSVIQLNDKKEKYHKKSFSSYVLQTKTHWIVEMIGMGYGMTIGRFLNPEEFKKDAGLIWEENKAFHPEFELAGLADDGMFNGNIHPRFTDSEIVFQKYKYFSEDTRKYELQDLEVHLNDRKETVLIHPMSEKPVLPLNLSLQTVNQRVGMYQFLNMFAPGIIDFQPLVLSTNRLAVYDRSVKILPRIEIENQIILRRKTWYFPSNQLVEALGHANDQSLGSLEKYLEEFNVPHQFFLSPVSNDIRQKPLFCNSRNPLFLKLIRRILNAADIVKITEPLPAFEDLAEKGVFKEDIFTWYVDYDI